MTLDLIAILPTALVSLLWYFFKQKDERISESIKLLWQRHDEDALALQELRLTIVSDHYKKIELDSKFNKVESAIISAADRAEKASKELADKFEKLSEVLIKHTLQDEQHQYNRRHDDNREQ